MLLRHLVPLVAALNSATSLAQVNPVMHYNTLSESMYLLQRCGELTSERRAWLERLRGNAIASTGWTAAERAKHDGEMKREFEQRYDTVPKEKCAELARSTDLERQTLKR